MRIRDFQRTAIHLFGGAATALGVVAVAGGSRQDEPLLLFVAVGWWAAAAVIGGWLGRRRVASPGMARLLASARSASTLPELEPGAVLFNRLWPLALFTVLAGGMAFLAPQVPAIAAGYALLVALTWRRQPAAVEAIEHRDGVEFWIERSSPFRQPKLIRLPGLRKLEPAAFEEREAAPL